jgi:hypothetical protein
VNSAALTDAVKGSDSVGAEPQQAIEDTQEFARGVTSPRSNSSARRPKRKSMKQRRDPKRDH